jgi:hypothetical protein
MMVNQEALTYDDVWVVVVHLNLAIGIHWVVDHHHATYVVVPMGLSDHPNVSPGEVASESSLYFDNESQPFMRLQGRKFRRLQHNVSLA